MKYFFKRGMCCTGFVMPVGLVCVAALCWLTFSVQVAQALNGVPQVLSKRIVVKSGIVSIKLSCPKSRSVRCAGKAHIFNPPPPDSDAGDPQTIISESRRFSLKPNQRTVVKLKLTSLGEKILARQRTLSVLFTVVFPGKTLPSDYMKHVELIGSSH